MLVGHIFSKMMLTAAASPRVANLAAGSPLVTPLVRRFVAGETLADAVAATRRLNEQGLHVALDNLGENTTSLQKAAAAVAAATDALDRVHADHLRAYLSIKLTQLGLDLGEHVVLANAAAVLECADRLGIFVRLDMEGSAYTTRTIEVFERLRGRYENVGIVLQAYLYRTMHDAEHLTSLGASIRLCKGAYHEAAHIAYRRKRDTDRNYVRIMEYLLREGREPALATHDPAIIAHACAFANQHHISPDRFEFQMLYGVRRDLQRSLAQRGYHVRVYVPFGAEWYPYMTRRLAERPANLLSIGRSIAHEGGAGPH